MRGELQQLSRRLGGLVARRPGVAVGVWGEAGIGKTHAIGEVLRAAACRSFTLHATQTPGAVAHALAPPGNMPAWLERPLERLGRGEELTPQHTAEALSGLLAACAPVILHVEDLHEAPSERLALWARLALRATHSRGVGLLVSSRTPPPEEFEAVRLTPLDRPGSDALLEAETGAPLPREALAWLFGRAVGNPLFTLEFFRFLARQGALWNDGHRWHWREPEGAFVPITVEALIEQTLRGAAVSPAHAEALGARAALGISASADLWAAVARLSPGELRRVEQDLRRAGVLASPAQSLAGEFAHPLYREVIARGLPPEGRRMFARRALAALSEDPRAAAALVEEAAPPADEARALLERATRAAREAGDSLGAARWQARSVAYRSGEDRARTALSAARALRHVNVAEAERLCLLASGLVASDLLASGLPASGAQAGGAGETRREAALLLAELLAEGGRGAEAERALARLGETERGGPAWAAVLIRVRGAANDDAGVLEVLRAYPGVLTGALEGVDADAISRAARALAHDGRLSEAAPLVERALAAPQLSAQERVMLLKAASVVAYMRADYARMEELEREVLSLARALGDLRLMDAALFNRAIALEGLGRLRERLECLEEALAVCRELGDPAAHAIAQMSYASLLTDLAEYERAESLLLEARAVLERVDLSAYLVGCEATLSQLYREWQPPHGRLLALKHAHAALAYARRRNTARLLVDGLCAAALAEAWAGSAGRAASLADEALARVSALDMPASRLEAQSVRAGAALALGRSAEARALWREVCGGAEAIGDETTARAAGLELARLDDDLSGARSLLAWFEARGLENLARRARRLFPALAATEPVGAERTEAEWPGERAPGARLEVLGALRFSREGRSGGVSGRKRRALLAALLEARLAGRAELTRLDLLDALYPQVPEEQAGAALRDVVHQVRASCGARTVLTTPGGYALGDVSSDAEDFLKGGDARLWRGPYLQDVDAPPESAVREALHLALHLRAGQLLDTDPAEAARLGRLLLEADPYDSGSLRLLLLALRAGANHRSLSRVYAGARSRFAEVGEALPETWGSFLASPPSAQA